VIARKDRGCESDLLIALLDQFLENLRACAQIRFNLSKRMLTMRAAND